MYTSSSTSSTYTSTSSEEYERPRTREELIEQQLLMNRFCCEETRTQTDLPYQFQTAMMSITVRLEEPGPAQVPEGCEELAVSIKSEKKGSS